VVLGIRALDSTEYPTIRRTQWCLEYPEISKLILADVLGIQTEEEEAEE